MKRILIGLSLLVLPAAAFQNIGISDAGPSRRLVKMTKPVYPPEAKAAGLEGLVRLEVVVGKDGIVRRIRDASGRPELIAAAADAVKDWAYEPVLKDGEPVEFLATVNVNFQMPGDAASAPGAKEAESSAGVQSLVYDLQKMKLVRKVDPSYPAEAKAARVQGEVKLAVTIGADGTAKQVRNASGPPLLIQPAVDAVRQWIWAPTLVNGVPVAVITDIVLNFQLSN